MTVFVFAGRKADADQWADALGIRPKDRVTFGTSSRWRDGIIFRPGDRIVVATPLDHSWEAIIARNLRRNAHKPDVERVAADPAHAAQSWYLGNCACIGSKRFKSERRRNNWAAGHAKHTGHEVELVTENS
jgi:hypothetical protein